MQQKFKRSKISFGKLDYLLLLGLKFLFCNKDARDPKSRLENLSICYFQAEVYFNRGWDQHVYPESTKQNVFYVKIYTFAIIRKYIREYN